MNPFQQPLFISEKVKQNGKTNKPFSATSPSLNLASKHLPCAFSCSFLLDTSRLRFCRTFCVEHRSCIICVGVCLCFALVSLQQLCLKLSFPHGFIVCEKRIHLLALFVSSMYHLCKDVQLSLKSSFPHGFKTTHLPLLSRFLPQVPSIVPSTIAHGFVICDKKCLRTWNKYVSASLASLQVQTATIWSRSQVARNKSCFGFADASFNRCLL